MTATYADYSNTNCDFECVVKIYPQELTYVVMQVLELNHTLFVSHGHLRQGVRKDLEHRTLALSHQFYNHQTVTIAPIVHNWY